MNMNFITGAINAAIQAGEAILEIYDGDEISFESKADDSPLTKADLVSNEIIVRELTASGVPILSEEEKSIPYDSRRHWDDFWLVDPLDGTKEFLKKNGEFTVNIAYCRENKPVFGVIYIPVSRELYYGDVAKGASYKITIAKGMDWSEMLFDDSYRLKFEEPSSNLIKVVGSRSHKSEATEKFIETLERSYDNVEIVSKGSSLKFCLVAEGKAHVYPRLAPTMEWDTAAGHAICNAVGLTVIDKETQKELVYNKENLLNPFFTVSS